VIVPPHEVQAVAVPLTLRYSPDMLIRLRPHITVSYPFVPFAELDAACDRLRQICATIAPFDLTMDGYGRFPNVIYMRPADPAPVRAVYEQIFAAFPDYPPYDGRFGTDLVPHLTIAQFDPAQQPALPAAYPPQRFGVDRLHVWYGPNDPGLPWLTYDVIHLHGGT
jgi:2'-5' RNA ligase